MAKTIQFKRGTTAQVNAFTGALGEIVVDTDKDVLVVHDGATQGGFAVAAKANADGTISLINKTGTSTSIASAGLFNNTLTSTATNQALTAAQGKVLQDSKVSYAASLGWNQTWQDMTATRVLGVNYTNSTGSPIVVAFTGTTGSSWSNFSFFVNDIFIFQIQGTTASAVQGGTLIVPDGATYRVTNSANGGSAGYLSSWLELR